MLARTTTRLRNVARKSVRFRNMRSYELSAANEGKRCLPSLTNYLQLIYVFAMSTRKEKLKMTPISEENKKKLEEERTETQPQTFTNQWMDNDVP